MEQETFYKCLDYSLKLLAIGKRTVAQLSRKLREKGYTQDIITKTVNDLKDKRLLDDREYARMFVEEIMQRKPEGIRKIRYDLVLKGIHENIIDEILGQVDEDYESRYAIKLAREKMAKLKEPDPLKKKKKVHDFLVRRGFDFDICKQAVNKVFGK